MPGENERPDDWTLGVYDPWDKEEPPRRQGGPVFPVWLVVGAVIGALGALQFDLLAQLWSASDRAVPPPDLAVAASHTAVIAAVDTKGCPPAQP